MHEINDAPLKKERTMPFWLMPALAVALAGATVWSMAGMMNERTRSGALEGQNKTLAANLDGVQNQVKTLSEQLDTLSASLHAERAQAAAKVAAAEPPAIAPAAPARPALRRVVVKAAPKPVVVSDPRIDEVQARLREHQKELTDTRMQLDKTRQDLEGSLSSTRDELNGSLARTNDGLARTNDTVARTHEELVELQKRGQRNYYEFTLDKSKGFQRVGPLSLSLRKANTKKRSFDFEMLVDDQKLQKKNVNLFEPVVIMTPEHGQAVQLVVNLVGKDVVKGYISEPKFKTPQLAAAAPSAGPALLQRPE